MGASAKSERARVCSPACEHSSAALGVHQVSATHIIRCTPPQLGTRVRDQECT
jgi:hypothetical protein